MQVTKVEAPKETRALVAVVGYEGNGIFFQNSETKNVHYICNKGRHQEFDHHVHYSLENVLRKDPTRKPIYKGDTVTLQF